MPAALAIESGGRRGKDGGWRWRWALVFGALVGDAALAEESLLEQARALAGQLAVQVRSELAQEMERSGPTRSLMVCKYSVPEIASRVSRQSGARVTRVSLKPRNPAVAAADAWEQRVLLDFDRRVAAGERAEKLEFSETVSEPAGRYFRYLKAVPTVAACLACHGARESFSPAVKSMLASEYPHDQAVGYRVGDNRGGVSVKIRL